MPFESIRHSPPHILEEIWRQLAEAAIQRQSPWRLPVLSTVGEIGPEGRIVVLRGVDPEQRRLIAHVDARSPKVTQLQATPHAVWTFFHPSEAIQLRVKTLARLHFDDEFAEEQWRLTPPSSRKSYLSTHAPSSPLPGPVSTLPEEYCSRELSEAELGQGRTHFCVVAGEVREFDWYDLNPHGHLRLRFTWQEDRFFPQWIAP
jgi:pyridoxine/pyridoxamine 5'-phosphate oxidase